MNIKLLDDYIKALILNIEREKIPEKPINLIFDSGAINGILGIGAALYIHHLEKIDYIKINKISGCSVGSLLGLWYSRGCPPELYPYIEIIFSHYKQNLNFFVFEKVVTDIVHHLFADENDTMLCLYKKLYINYYDTLKCKQCVVTRFKNRKHLIKCILRSCHIPFLMNGSVKFKNRYVDGIAPYIFKSHKNKNLFIKLISFINPISSLNIKNEKNIYTRLIKGIVDVNDFFLYGQSDMCSYVCCSLKIQLQLREYCALLFLSLIELTLLIHNYLPSSFRETFVYNQLILLLQKCWYFIQKNLT